MASTNDDGLIITSGSMAAAKKKDENFVPTGGMGQIVHRGDAGSNENKVGNIYMPAPYAVIVEPRNEGGNVTQGDKNYTATYKAYKDAASRLVDQTDEAANIKAAWSVPPKVSINNGNLELSGTSAFLKSNEAKQLRETLKGMKGKTYNTEKLNKQVEAWNSTFRRMSEQYLDTVDAMNQANSAIAESAGNAEYHKLTFSDMQKIGNSAKVGKSPEARTSNTKIFVGFDWDKNGKQIEKWVEAKEFFKEFNSMDDDKKRSAYRDLITRSNNGDVGAYSKLMYLNGKSKGKPANVDYDAVGDFFHTMGVNLLTGLAEAADFVTTYVPVFNTARLTGRIVSAASSGDINDFFKSDDIRNMIDDYEEAVNWENAYFSQLTPGSTQAAAIAGSVVGNVLGMAYSIWAGGVGNSAMNTIISRGISSANQALMSTGKFTSFERTVTGVGQAASGGDIMAAGSRAQFMIPTSIVTKFPNFSAALADKALSIMQIAGIGTAGTMPEVLSVGDRVGTLTTNTVAMPGNFANTTTTIANGLTVSTFEGGATISSTIVNTLSGKALFSERMFTNGIATAFRLAPLAGESALRHTDQYLQKVNAGEDVGDMSSYVMENTARDLVWGGALMGAGAVIKKLRGVSAATRVSPASAAEGAFDLGSQDRWYTPGEGHFTYDKGSNLLPSGLEKEKDLQDLVSAIITANGESIFVSPNRTPVGTDIVAEKSGADFINSRGFTSVFDTQPAGTVANTEYTGDFSSVEFAPIPNTTATETGKAFGAVSSRTVTSYEVEPTNDGANLVKVTTNIDTNTTTTTKEKFSTIDEATDKARELSIPTTSPKTVANSDALKDATVAPLTINGVTPDVMPKGVSQVKVEPGIIYRTPDALVNDVVNLADREGWHVTNQDRLYKDYERYVQEAQAQQANFEHFDEAPAVPKEMYGTDVDGLIRLAAWAKANNYNLIPMKTASETISEHRYKKFSMQDLYISKLADKYELPELDASSLIENSRGEMNEEYYGTDPNGTLQYVLSSVAPQVKTDNIEEYLTPEEIGTIDIYGALSILLQDSPWMHYNLSHEMENRRIHEVHDAGVRLLRGDLSRAVTINVVYGRKSKDELLDLVNRFAGKYGRESWVSKEQQEREVSLVKDVMSKAIEEGYSDFKSLAQKNSDAIREFRDNAFDTDRLLKDKLANGVPLTSDISVPVEEINGLLIYSELDKYNGKTEGKKIAHIPAGTKVAKRESKTESGIPQRTMEGGRFYDWAFDTSSGMVVGDEVFVNKPNGAPHSPTPNEYDISDYGVYDMSSDEGMRKAADEILEPNKDVVFANRYQRETRGDNGKTIYDVTEPGGPVNRINHVLRQQVAQGTIPKDSISTRVGLANDILDRALQEGNGYEGEYGSYWSTEPVAIYPERIDELTEALRGVLAGGGQRGATYTLDTGSNILLEGSELSRKIIARNAIRSANRSMDGDNAPSKEQINRVLNMYGLSESDLRGGSRIDDYLDDVDAIINELASYGETIEEQTAAEIKSSSQVEFEKIKGMLVDLVIKYNSSPEFKGDYSVYMKPLLGGIAEKGSHNVKVNMHWGLRGLTELGNFINTSEGVRTRVGDLKVGDRPIWPSMDFASFNLSTPNRYASVEQPGDHKYYVLTGSPKGTGFFFFGDPKNFGKSGNDSHIHMRDGGAVVYPMNMKTTIVSIRELGPNATLIIQIRDGADGTPYSGPLDEDSGVVYRADQEKTSKINKKYEDIAKKTGVDLRELSFDITNDDNQGLLRMLNETPGATREGSLRDYNRDYKGKEVSVVLMNPNDYIRILQNVGQTPDQVLASIIEDPHTAQYATDMENGDKFPTPILGFSSDGSFYKQEGRHRAIAAISNEVEFIPVAIEHAPGADLKGLLYGKHYKDITEEVADIITISSEQEQPGRVRVREDDEVVTKVFENNILGTEYGIPSEYFSDDTSALEWQKQGGERAIYKLDESSDVLERPPVTTDTLQEQPLLLTAGGDSSAHIQRFNDLMLTMPTLADSPVDYTNGIVDIVNVVRDIYSQVAMNINMDQLYENYGRAIAAGETPTATPNERATLQPLTQVLDALGHYFDPSGKSLTQEFYLPTGLKPKKQVNIVDAILGKDGAVDEDNPVDGNLDDILLDPLRVGDSGFWQKRTGDLFRDADGNFTMDKSGTLEENLIAYTVSALTRGKNKLAVAANNEVARSKFDKNRSQITSKQALAMLKDADTVRTKSRGIQAKIAKDSEALAELKENYSGDESTIDKAIKEKNYAKELNYTNSVNTMAQKGGYNQFLQMNPIQGSTLRFGANANGFRGIANIRRKLEKVNVTGTMWVERYGEKVNVGFGLEAGEANFKTYGHFRPEPAVNLGTLVNLHFDADRSAAAFLNQIHTNLQNWANGEGWDLMSAISEFARENFPLITDYEWATAQLMKKIGQNYHKYHNPEEAYIANAEEISKWIRKNTLSCFNNAIMMSNISNLDNRTIEALDEAAAYMLVGTPVKRSKAINYAQEAAVWSALGLNSRVAIGNLLNEPLRLIDVVGYKGFVSAWKTALNPKEAARINNILSDLPSRFDNPEMVGLAEKAKGTFGKLKDKASNVVLSPLEKSEQFKNILFWAAAEQNAAARFPGDKSRQLQETLRFFNDYAIAGGKGTTPGIATGSFGRTLNIFKTFTLRNFDDFIDFVEKVARGESGNNYWDKKYEKKHKDNNYKDKTGRNKFDPKIAARVIGGRIFRSYIFWLLVGSYFGKSFIDSLGGDPSGITEGGYDQGLYDDPDTDDYEGMTDFDNFVNSLPAGFILGALQDMYFAARRRGVEQGQFLGFDILNDPRFTKSLESKLPLGVAKNRFADMLDLIDRGYSFSSTGRKTYAAPETALDVIKGFLFGKSTTQNSLAYGKYRYGMVDIWGDLSSGDWMDFAMNANPISGNAEFDTTRKDYTGVFNGSWNDISTMQLIIQRFRERQQTIINEFNQDKYRYGGEWQDLTDEQKVAKAKEIRSKKIDEYTEDVVRAVEAFTDAGNALSDKQITTMMYLFDFHEGEEDDEWNSSYARERYVEAGLPDYDAAGIQRKEQKNNGKTSEETRNILDRSLVLQNAQQGFYGSSKEAANAMKDVLKDFNSTYKEYNARVKALNEEYFAARKKNKKSAEAKRLSTEIEKVQNEYLDKLYDKLSPVIERYGTALVGTYDGADVLKDYMGNMIPYSSIKKYGQTFSSGNDIVYGQLTEWLQKRWGRNAPTAPSDKEVTNGISEIKKLLDQGKTATAKSKARAILEKIGRGSLGARRDDVETLRSYAYD